VGRSIGDGLKFLIKRSKANEPGALCTWIDEWEAKECERLAKKNAESAIQVVQDRAAMVRELALECVSVKDILARIDALFSDEVPGDRVMLSTVHRVKGDERETVYLLRDTFDKVRAGMKKRGKDTSEEDRVMYVAVTRAARRLVYTETPKHEE
jgi:superfamily I DNA/RNA helicase